MGKHNARFNDAPVLPVHSSDNMLVVFNRNDGIMIDESGDGSFYKFDPESAWSDCDDSAYYSALGEILTYVITVAACYAIYNVKDIRRGKRIEDVIRAWERAILEVSR